MKLGVLLLLLAAGLPACGTGAAPAEDIRRELVRHQQVKRHNRQFYVGIAEADKVFYTHPGGDGKP